MKSNIAVTILLGITLIGFFAIYPIANICASDQEACALAPIVTPTNIPPTLTCTPTPEEVTPTITPQISTAAASDNTVKEAGNSGEMIQAPTGVSVAIPSYAPNTGHAQ